jgi:hypothetical protein
MKTKIGISRYKVVKMVHIFRPGQFFLNLKKKFFILLLYRVRFFLKIKKKLKAGLPGHFRNFYVMKTIFTTLVCIA